MGRAAQLPADMVVLFDDGVHLDNRIAVMDNLHSRMLSRLGNSAYRFDSLDIKTTIEKQDNFIITGQATLTRTATQEPDYTVTVPFTAVLGNQAGQHLAPLMLMVHYPSALLFAHSDKIQDNTSKKSERIYWFLIGCGLGLITLASIATLKRGLKNT